MVLKSLLRKFTTEAVEDTTGAFVVRTAAELLEPHRHLLHEIRQLAGVTDRVWDTCYAPAYREYAALVQMLPASEAHHHAAPGGLLRHGLEVSLEALRIRQGHLLPPGVQPEQIAARQDLWTYCCAMGGLLHDVGKPLVDQTVTMTSGLAWTLLSGPMPHGERYRVRFRPDRVHRTHERAAALIAGRILPAAGLEWIAGDSEALLAWLDALAGDTTGLLGQIVSRADQVSVSHDLARGVPTRMPGVRARPLAEVLLNGLRELLRSGALPCNRPGAAAFLDRDGELWLVSKRVLDELRGFLTQDGQGIPSRNDRLMDELQQHGLLLANGDRAIWRCEIRQGDWSSTLTCLRMPAHLIWPEDEMPEPFAGSVTVVEAVAESETENETTSSGDGEGEAGEATADAAETGKIVLPSPELPEPPEPSPPTDQDDTETDQEATEPSDVVPISAPDAGRSSKRGPGEAFVSWLQDQIRDRRMKINAVDARIHVVPEGLVLVSPAIFRDYDPVNWRSAQRAFQRLGLHRRRPDETNIWTCEVQVDSERERKRSYLKGFLIPDAEQVLGVNLPRPNRAVRLLQDPPVQTEGDHEDG